MNTNINAIGADDTFAPEEMDAMRAQVDGIMAAENKSQADLARESGVAYATFSAWRNGKYEGNNARVAASVQVWLSSRDEQKRTAAQVPQPPAFIRTESAAAFVDTLRFAQVMPEISVIAGGAGIGKTVAARHYQATNPNVWLATMDPSTSGVNAMMQELCEVLGVQEKSATKLARAIGRRVAGSGGLILVDEAQHLTPAALDQLRSIYDRYAIGIALVGNELVYARLEGEGRKANFAQLFSRIGVRTTQARPRAKDMCALIEAWGVKDAEAIRFLKAIARKPGALRSMTKCLQLGSMAAAGAREPLSMKHLKGAYERLSTSVTAE